MIECCEGTGGDGSSIRTRTVQVVNKCELGVLSKQQVRKNATFCAMYILNASFYQDRLGTNIGKAEKRVALFAGARAGRCLS